MSENGYSFDATNREETHLFRLSGGFARREKLPVYFVGRVTADRPKAIRVVGRGTLDTKAMGVCSVCGLPLTHPVSVILGIGPQCGGHWWDWKAIGGYNAEALESLKVKIHNVKVDTWVPKSCVIEVHPTDDKVDLPKQGSIELAGSNGQIESPKEGTEAERYAVLVGEEVHIFFPTGPTFSQDLENVRTLDGRHFVGTVSPKYWRCPATVDNIIRLDEFGFKLDEMLKVMLSLAEKIADEDVGETESYLKNLAIAGELYPFQKEGVQFLEKRRGRALLADQMGLGKTIQALAYIAAHPRLRPAVIVCPASLKLNWRREARKWIPGCSVRILEGRKPYLFDDSDVDFIIINYDVLGPWVDTILEYKPQVLIMDECHAVKNHKANRTAACKLLAAKVPHVIGLTGTPVVNRPIEFFNALQMIDKSAFPMNRFEFGKMYCNAKYTRFGWDFSGSSNLDRLHKRLVETVMLRRLKEDVLKDLPDKQYTVVPMEMTSTVDYDKALAAFRMWRDEMDEKRRNGERVSAGAEVLVQIEKLKQICLKGKLPQAVEWIRDFIEGNGKLVVFTTHTEGLQSLMKEFGDKAVKLDGSSSQTERQEAVDRFQEDDTVRLFVGNIKAAGVGITLTAASSVAFLELPWTPGDLDQATDRVHRIGQKDSVNVYYLVAENTIEDSIVGLLDSKRKVISKAVDGKEADEESLFAALLAQI